MWQLLAIVLGAASAAPAADGTVARSGDGSTLETLLAGEVDRAVAALSTRPEPPHYLSLAMEDWEQVNISARDGTLAQSKSERARFLDVDVRTGSPDLDSTHPLRGFSALAEGDRQPIQVPWDDGYALRHAIWRALDAQYRGASERIVVLRANRRVKVEEEDPAPDFEPRTPVVATSPPQALSLSVAEWESRLVALSRRMEAAPEVFRGVVMLQAERVVKTFVDSEGTRLTHGRVHARISFILATVAPDGDEVTVFDATDVHDPDRLPSVQDLERRADAAVAELRARLAAPRADPYSGPVLLTGRAAGVFFHEVLGHRVEGHRQKREDEGKTFADQIGRRVLPTWIDVVDDPTLAVLAGQELNGHYAFDDEGVAASPAVIVKNGVFTGFLMGRSPIPGFETSNGHGRRSVGNKAESRMGNTVVSVAGGRPMGELRKRLAALVREQGLDYGYIVDEIEGGFTMTGRVTPNAFNVRAASTWRVYADGRPDQRVRGIDLVGTPLVAFGNLVAAGDDPAVFNGTCGAESGWVPVAAVSPSLLFSRLEFQLKEKGQERPPLLAKPGVPDDGSSGLEGP